MAITVYPNVCGNVTVAYMSYYILKMGFIMNDVLNHMCDGETPYYIHYYLASANQTWQLRIL